MSDNGSYALGIILLLEAKTNSKTDLVARKGDSARIWDGRRVGQRGVAFEGQSFNSDFRRAVLTDVLVGVWIELSGSVALPTVMSIPVCLPPTNCGSSSRGVPDTVAAVGRP
jgi:hypothetical protein